MRETIKKSNGNSRSKTYSKRDRESIEWLIIRLYTAEERISEIEDQIVKITQTET